MLLKWIICRVPEEWRAAFSTAQAGWGALRGVDGFGGQWGGWNAQSPEEACILALWRDEAAYQHFMDAVHDSIFVQTEQRRTYESIAVTRYDQIELLDWTEDSRRLGDELHVELTHKVSKATWSRHSLCLPSAVTGEKRIRLLDAWHVPSV